MQPKRVLIIGGGFGGVLTALSLAQKQIPNLHITLVSDKHHFEYTPALYKLATGRSPMEMCIPLGQIFDGTHVDFLIDTMVGGSLSEKVIYGASGSHYTYDYLILALGAETTYFNIPGIAENSFSIKTVESTLKLKNHLHTIFNTHNGLSKGELMAQFQFVIIGGGPAGVELAGNIRRYARELAYHHGIPEKLITVDILQGAPRLLPTMSEKVSALALKQLNKLGINIILNKAVTGEDEKGVYLKDIQLNAKTIIWTAGVRANHLYSTIKGLELDKAGRVLVDNLMRAGNTENVFVIGDGASTPFAGTAQTAVHDGSYVARVITASLLDKKLPVYKPHQTPYVVPIGNNWAIFTYKNIAWSGRIFWWLRELIDLRFFLSILPLRSAWTIWREGGILCESCPTCQHAEAHQSHH